MNKSLSVFLSVLLCVVLYVGVLLVRYTTDESDYWQSSQVYTSSAPAGAPSVSFGVGANGDVLAVPMSSRPSRGSVRYSSPHRLVTSSPNHLTTSSPIGITTGSSQSAGVLYTTSSATMKSFGGGGSYAGVSMSGGVVSGNSQSPIANNQLSLQGIGSADLIASSLNTPLTSSPNNLITSSSNSLITSSPLAANYQGLGNATMGDPRGIRGRLNAAPTNNGYDSWLRWLDINGDNHAEYDEETGTYTYSEQGAWEAYVAWYNDVYECNPGEYTGMKPQVTWDMWLSWFKSNNGSHQGDKGLHNFVPVGDYLPLLFMALLYVAYIFIRYRELKKNMN